MKSLFQADVDGNGFLDYGEFVAVSIHIKKMGTDDHLRKVFAYFDANKSGFIEIDELKKSLVDDLGPNPDDIINVIIRDVDTDKVVMKSIVTYSSSLLHSMKLLTNSHDLIY